MLVTRNILAAWMFAMPLTLCCPYRICIIAGDISPIDVVIHLPVMCEDRDIPYIYVPSKDVGRSEDC